MFYAMYSCFRDFSFGRPCIDIPWCNTVIDISAQEGEIQVTAATSVVTTTTGGANSVIDISTTSVAPSPPYPKLHF